jgi:hypothetical protein
VEKTKENKRKEKYTKRNTIKKPKKIPKLKDIEKNIIIKPKVNNK